MNNYHTWNETLLSDIIDFNPKEKLTKGTIAKKIPMDCLKSYNKCIDNHEKSSYSGGAKFENTISALMNNSDFLIRTNIMTAQLRDILLPKLMSGEVGVPFNEVE